MAPRGQWGAILGVIGSFSLEEELVEPLIDFVEQYKTSGPPTALHTGGQPRSRTRSQPRDVSRVGRGSYLRSPLPCSSFDSARFERCSSTGSLASSEGAWWGSDARM